MKSNYFIETRTNIIENTNLRDPQIDAYVEVYDHFINKNKTNHAIIVLPTEVEKQALFRCFPLIFQMVEY